MCGPSSPAAACKFFGDDARRVRAVRALRLRVLERAGNRRVGLGFGLGLAPREPVCLNGVEGRARVKVAALALTTS